jgi:hypothetical protein
MLVLSAGMQKSGTGWYYNMTHDLVVAAGHDDARGIRDKYGLHSILNTRNCNVRGLEDAAMRQLDRISQEGHTFVVKTHLRPTRLVRRLMAEGHLKATYIFRDLRDAVLSCLDRGRVMRETGDLKGRHFLIGPQKSFAKYHTVQGAIRWVQWRLLPVWRAWTEMDGVLVTRYEDVHADTHRELRRLAVFLDLDVSDEQIESIVARYHRDRVSKDQGHTRLHFNKGIVGRYESVMSSEQRELCRKRLGRYLEKMGYAV